MAVFPVIIDSRPAYLGRGSVPTSLLLTPLGTGTLLDHVQSLISKATEDPLTVLPTFEPVAEYEQAVAETSSAVKHVVPAARFSELLAGYESSDFLLVMDPRCFSVNGFDPASLVRDGASSPCAKHVVPLGTSLEGTREFVHLDTDKRVRRIERYCPGVTWLQGSGVVYSLVSVASACLATELSLESLSELRRDLISRGFPCNDILLADGAFDLTEESGLLSLVERMILKTTTEPPPTGYSAMVDGVYVGQRCKIDPSVRLYGPVIIQHGVTIDAEVVIIGPTLLGSGCRVKRNSTVAQCVALQGTVVPRETTICHRVVCGSAPPDSFRSGDKWLEEESIEHTDPQPAVVQAMAPLLKEGNRRRSVYLGFKRIVESTIALLGLIVLSPLLIITGLLIKLGSRGPVLFVHEREGKDGKVFRCWKFRTMVEGAHAQQRELYSKNAVDGPQFDLPSDPRVTRLGRQLRLSNLDELPQLINVLLGQMSLIGPRPSPFRENQICIPWRLARLSVRPGITGLWQVCRQERSAGDFHQWIYYDMLYVRHVSFWLDAKILIATVVTLAGRWSVPLSWMIPDRKLHAECRMSATLERSQTADHTESQDRSPGTPISEQSRESPRTVALDGRSVFSASNDRDM